MTACVVHDLELVQIEKDERVNHVAAPEPVKTLLDPRLELPPVRQVCQRIMGRLPGEALLFSIQGRLERLTLQYQSSCMPDDEQDQKGRRRQIHERQHELHCSRAGAKNFREGIGPNSQLAVDLVKSRRKKLKPGHVRRQIAIHFGMNGIPKNGQFQQHGVGSGPLLYRAFQVRNLPK